MSTEQILSVLHNLNASRHINLPYRQIKVLLCLKYGSNIVFSDVLQYLGTRNHTSVHDLLNQMLSEGTIRMSKKSFWVAPLSVWRVVPSYKLTENGVNSLKKIAEEVG